MSRRFNWTVIFQVNEPNPNDSPEEIIRRLIYRLKNAVESERGELNVLSSGFSIVPEEKKSEYNCDECVARLLTEIRDLLKEKK